MYNECLLYPCDFCRHHKMHGGESEVWVVETDIFGYTKLPVECFRYSSISESEREKANERMSHVHVRGTASLREGSLLMSSMPVDILPCERNWLIKRLIKRELDKDAEFLEKLRAFRG